MPKKACCCNQISWPTSCCKPPEASCVGSDINISVDIYVKFYCQPNGNILIWKCSNGSQNPIDFETEHWRMTLTYSLSQDDVAPKIPSLTYEGDYSNTYNYYENIGGTANPSWGASYWGAFGFVGGFVRRNLYGSTAGEFPVKGSCAKCVDPCDSSGQINGCKTFSYSDDTGQIITGCGLPVQYQLFPPLYYYIVVNCEDCCNQNPNDDIDLSAKYNACDTCHIGGLLREDGTYALGVKTIEGGTYSNNVLDTDLALRDGTSWSFEFIPSYDGHVSKLNIELLSCHFGCSTNSNMYVSAPLAVYGETVHLTDFYPTLNPIPRYYDNICVDNQLCGISLANPNLIDKVCLTMNQYYNPPVTMGVTCRNLPPCGCIAGGPNGCNGSPGEVTGGVGGGFGGTPNRYFLTDCGCTCGDPYSCHRWFHRSADPDEIRRPHELNLELGIGYRDVSPCGDHIEMDFYEELYLKDLFDPSVEPIKIEKVLTSSNGNRYVNPEWITGVFSAGAEEIFSGYNYYSQGLRMKLTYTRNSIPYEKYVYNNVGDNCVPVTSVGGITGFTAQNKIYPEYPKQGHPNMFEHPQGIYEGEYALSKISYWTPSVNATYDVTTAPAPPGGWAIGGTYGTQQENPPVDVSAFNRCYPFNTPFLSSFINVYPFSTFDSNLTIDTDDPIAKQGYPITYRYSYGDITAIVTQS